MSKMSKFLITTALLAVALPSVAMASPVTGTGTGTFSNLSNSCGNNCGIVNTGNGNDTQVQWGSTSSFFNLVDPSTLTADKTNISVSTSTNNVVLAELTWFNSSTRSDQTPSTFGVHYNLSINFTAPGVSSDAEPFDLTIDNTDNPLGDDMGAFTLADLSTLSFSLPGWTISGFQYVTDDGTSILNSSCGTTGTKTTWCNPEDHTADLFIEANFTQTAVPEPASWTMMLGGLLAVGGFAFAWRRKQQTQV